jgi:thioredoxin reductase
LQVAKWRNARKLLLATGVVDRIPSLQGIAAFYGRSIFHCPYCDGWEVRGQPIGIYGNGEAGYGLALELTVWSRDLVLLTDGHAELTQNHLDRLTRNGIRICQRNIASLEGKGGILETIRFEDGTTLDRRALFLACGEWQGSDLAAKLGCTFTPKGAVHTGTYETTNIPGLYVAGDASRYVQLSIVAAAEGAEAAFAMNTALLREDLA